MKTIKTTERLILQEATLKSANFLLKLLNSEGWIKNIGDRNVKTIKEAENYLKEKILPSYSKMVLECMT